MTVDVEEGQRQMIVLALAELALSRPGWDWTLGETAKLFHAESMFAEFKRLNADRVKAERAPMSLGPLTAQSDDPELVEWISNAKLHGGGFVSTIAEAALRADTENWALMRVLMIELRTKYPAYEPTDAVKQEIRERGK